ncbi:Muscle-specific protein 20-like [Oopsacas minuta]|uniref:Muscle-specific protein 20-like n=1 Tax=Oopsacas minuta TaxID=111878 RepID=A0AAV7K5A0_9METZ|nr:Muscle-specific protein 20-like [Oopsacas minuta]
MAQPEYKNYNQIRATKSGMNAELQKKMLGEYSVEAEIKVKQWVEEVTHMQCEENFFEWLRDGTVLCHLMNIIDPGSVPLVKKSSMPFKQMECINFFLIAAEQYGIKKTDLFVTLDLYEDNNPSQVVSTLRALDRLSHINGFNGPTYAPKQSEYNPRDFSKEKMDAGKTIIGAQYGYVTGASQKGLTAYGRRRDIFSAP